mgnify:CR=1 FL=1
MKQSNALNQKRINLKRNTTTSQASQTTINNTSISSVPNISMNNSNQNKPQITKQNASSDIKNNNIESKFLSKDSPNKNKKSNIPFRKNKNNKILIDSKSTKNNANILNDSFGSKISNEGVKLSRRNSENYNYKFRNNSINNSFIKKQSNDNREIIPYRNKKYSFSAINTDLSLDFTNTTQKKNNARTFYNKTTKPNTKSKSKYNFYLVKSHNVSKMNWNKDKSGIPFDNKRTLNLKKVKNLSPSKSKSYYYQEKKMVTHPQTFENYKHFSPLVKNNFRPREKYIKKKKITFLNRNESSPTIKKSKTFFKINNLKNKNIPNQNNSEKNENQNSIIINNSKSNNQLPLIETNNKNKRVTIKDINNNKNENNNKDENNDINNANKNDFNNNLNDNNSIDNENFNESNINRKKNLQKEIDKKEISPDKIKIKRHQSTSFQSINRNFINNDIPKIVSKNYRLSKKIQKELEGVIDNSHCVYCLKRVTQPITLSCGHELCLSCAEEIISLYKFTHIPTIEHSFIKCPKCKTKSNILDNDLNNMLRLNWTPSKPQEKFDKNNLLEDQEIMERKLQYCEICPNSKYIRDIAEFECLNCDIILCYECKVRHLSNPRHQSHKIISYTKIVQEKVELSLCDKHREPTKLFCETCMKSICIICAQYDNDHINHKINTIKNILDNQAIELTGNIRVCERQIKIIEELIGQMIYSKQKLEEEKKIFIDKLNKNIEELFIMINNKKMELNNYIENLFKNKLDSLENKLKNFEYVKNRYEYYRNLICDRDIDIIDRVIQIKKLNKKICKIENLGLLNPSNFNKSFSQSLFVNEPNKDIEKILKKYAFLPITDLTIENLIKIFNESNIIRKELIYKDFIIILPKIKSGILLFSTLTDEISTVSFHKKCDNKGPTLTIVKTVDGHIFGGYNPRSWVSESMYNECDDSFLFSLSDGKSIKPVKCPLKEYKKSTAIYQNEELNSPGWGEVSEADLFISYKNLSNSYSNLGRCYKAPKNVEPNCFLAGKPTKWDIDLIEIYAVEIVSDEEYYKQMLN